jgi:hypothetical protein
VKAYMKVVLSTFCAYACVYTNWFVMPFC